MNGPARTTPWCALFALLLVPVLALADEETSERANTREHEHHKNHMGGFLGASTHLDTDDTGATLGVEYARMMSKSWAIAGYIEMVSSSAERDFIFLVTALFYPWRGLGVGVGPGFEVVEKEVDHHGEIKTEKEAEFILRFGGGYGWSITPEVSLGPVVFADVTRSRWTIVYGVAWTVGF
jgi:hypothetical protein